MNCPLLPCLLLLCWWNLNHFDAAGRAGQLVLVWGCVTTSAHAVVPAWTVGLGVCVIWHGDDVGQMDDIYVDICTRLQTHQYRLRSSDQMDSHYGYPA